MWKECTDISLSSGREIAEGQKSTMSRSTKVVLITGASSGIGEATARVLASQGDRVVLGAPRTDRLEKITAAIRSAGKSENPSP
jgi:NADP-dependent 3-hydroxy acid dehydrogenase YdfG